MTPIKTNPKVDALIQGAPHWQGEISALRDILLSFDLAEEIKWAKPSYLYDGHIVVIIIPFKESCTLLFFKGGLMKDPQGLLIRPTTNTEAGRQMQFTSVKQIKDTEAIIRAYVEEAIGIEKAGLKMPPKEKKDIEYPEELIEKFEESPQLQEAFEALTPGRQREYVYYFSSAKQSETRASRIEKLAPHILAGKGFRE